MLDSMVSGGMHVFGGMHVLKYRLVKIYINLKGLQPEGAYRCRQDS